MAPKALEPGKMFCTGLCPRFCHGQIFGATVVEHSSQEEIGADLLKTPTQGSANMRCPLVCSRESVRLPVVVTQRHRRESVGFVSTPREALTLFTIPPGYTPHTPSLRYAPGVETLARTRDLQPSNNRL